MGSHKHARLMIFVCGYVTIPANFLPLPPRIGRAKQARPSEGNAGEQASGKPSPAPVRAPGEQRTRCSRT